MKITSITKIGEILDNYPETYGVFIANGFNSNSVEELIDLLGKDTMLQTILKVKGINIELFINMINEKINSDYKMGNLEYNLYDPSLKLDILVQTPCPARILFKEGITEILKKHEEETGNKLNCFVVDGCGSPYIYQDIWKEDDIDKLPDIILSKGIDEFYNKEFIDKFVKTGRFENVIKTMDKEFLDAGCLDDAYTLNSSLVKVMVIDEKKLGHIPKPKKWSDLLDPIYKNKIVAFGTERGIAKLTLMHLHKEYGMDAIKKFANNVKSIQHGAKMAKTAGTNSSESGAIYIIPLTFAKICEGNNLSIVWPEDGATIMPMSILIKKDKVKELEFVIDFLLNDYGEISKNINAVSLNPSIKNDVPERSNFRWLGWDYIKSNDIVTIGNNVKEEFHKIWDEK